MHLNYLAVLVCGVIYFVLGGLWYSVLFGQAWLKATKLDPEKMDKTGVGKLFAGSGAAGFLLALSVAYILGIAHAENVMDGLRVGWTLWLGIICAATAGDYLFLRRGIALYVINMGLLFVNVTISSVLLTLWR